MSVASSVEHDGERRPRRLRRAGRRVLRGIGFVALAAGVLYAIAPPFILPADGFIGLLYADPSGPYSRSNPHQGIDIFSQGDPGQTPVYAAYDGYITRQEDWRSTLIQRVPVDPLEPGRVVVLDEERGFEAIASVEIRNPLLHAGVVVVVEDEPLELSVDRPL